MFNESVTNTNFAGSYGSLQFPNIMQAGKFERFKDEVSWISTTRALLGNRVGDDNVIVFINGIGERFAGETVCSIVSGEHNTDSTLFIFEYLGGDKQYGEVIEDLEKALGGLDGFRRVDDLSKFVEGKQLCAKFYINEKMKRFLIVTKTLNGSELHFLQALITRYFPWYFKDKPIDKEETDLVTSLIGRSAAAYRSALSAIESRYDFRSTRIRAYLPAFEKVLYQGKLGRVRSDIASIERKMQAARIELSKAFNELEIARIKECGLMTKIESGVGDNEFMEYFLANKSLNLITAEDDGRVEFIVSTTLDNFDPDVFEPLVSNHDGYFYRRHGMRVTENFTDDQIEMLLRAIFETETVKLRMVAAFMIDFSGCIVEAYDSYDFPKEFDDYMPNPHLYYHSCLGSNEGRIYECVEHHDYIGAVECCVAATKNVGLSDGIVMGQFMQYIFDCGNKFFQLPDGSLATTDEVMAWLDENA